MTTETQDCTCVFEDGEGPCPRCRNLEAENSRQAEEIRQLRSTIIDIGHDLREIQDSVVSDCGHEQPISWGCFNCDRNFCDECATVHFGDEGQKAACVAETTRLSEQLKVAVDALRWVRDAAIPRGDKDALQWVDDAIAAIAALEAK